MSEREDTPVSHQADGVEAPDAASLPPPARRRAAPARGADPEVVHVIDLVNPVKWGPERSPELIHRLEFVRAQGFHVFDIDGADTSIGSLFRIAAKLARIPYEVLELLEPQDAAAVMEYVSGVMLPLRLAAARASAGGAAT